MTPPARNVPRPRFFPLFGKFVGGVIIIIVIIIGFSVTILKGLQSDVPVTREGGFPVFAAAGARPITLEDIRAAEDDAA